MFGLFVRSTHSTVQHSSSRATFEPLEIRRLFAIGSIGGSVFDDLNGNGVFEAGEPGIAGQRVFLDENKDGIFQSTEENRITGADGSYVFQGIPAGTYRVRHVVPSGRRITAPAGVFYTLTLPSVNKQINFGNTNTGIVRGQVFRDINGDGIKQSGEPVLTNWRLFLDKNGDGIYQAGVEKTRLTDANGNYRFAGLPAGTYHLRIVQQAGFMLTNPHGGGFSVNVAAGASYSNRNFAERALIP